MKNSTLSIETHMALGIVTTEWAQGRVHSFFFVSLPTIVFFQHRTFLSSTERIQSRYSDLRHSFLWPTVNNKTETICFYRGNNRSEIRWNFLPSYLSQRERCCIYTSSLLHPRSVASRATMINFEGCAGIYITCSSAACRQLKTGYEARLQW